MQTSPKSPIVNKPHRRFRYYKKPSYRWDSQPYCLTADYLVISDCC